jgi:hypothetical protein
MEARVAEVTRVASDLEVFGQGLNQEKYIRPTKQHLCHCSVVPERDKLLPARELR